jgi:hypothetical protein
VISAPTAAVGGVFTKTVEAAVSEQDPLETNTEYVVAVVGDTVIGFVVAPVFQE